MGRGVDPDLTPTDAGRGALTRTGIADRLAARGLLTREQAARVLEHTLALMTEGLARDGACKVTGFGTLGARPKARRTGRDFRTGAALAIDGRTVVTFRPSRALRERIAREAAHSAPAAPGVADTGALR
jgi:nucleoid DNA-binding protein